MCVCAYIYMHVLGHCSRLIHCMIPFSVCGWYVLSSTAGCKRSRHAGPIPTVKDSCVMRDSEHMI